MSDSGDQTIPSSEGLNHDQIIGRMVEAGLLSGEGMKTREFSRALRKLATDQMTGADGANPIAHPDGSDLRLRQSQAEEIRFFSTTNTSSQRRAAPPPLDLTSAAPVGVINDATHYLAVPMSGSGVDVAAVQAQLEEMDLSPGQKPVKLLKHAIKNLGANDLAGMKEPFFKVIPVPQTGGFEKFSLKTPLTTGQEVASKLKHMVAACEADIQAAKEKLAKPVQKKYIPNRADILLNCSLYGQPNLWRLEQSAMGFQARIARAAAPRTTLIGHRKQPFDLITAVFQIPELATRVMEYLPGEDITNLYCTSLQAHVQINTRLESSFSIWSHKWAPDARQVFDWRTSYKHMTIPDPAGGLLRSLPPRIQPAFLDMAQYTRQIPSLKYFCMIARRDETVADILAHLARQGLRCPAGTKTSVLKMWSLMEKPTNDKREAFMRNTKFITDQDLVNMMIFHCKLSLRFNDPVYGSGTNDLTELFMGQKSLICLWEMLFGHNYRDTVSMIKLSTRYDANRSWRLGQDDTGAQGLRDFMQPTGPGLLGVHPNEIGRISLENWGAKGSMSHLLRRPSECILRESVRRVLSFDKHMMPFFLWGSIDVASGRNLCPSEADIYMEDADFKNRRIDTHLEITPLHVKRSRWDELTHDERRAVLLAQSMRQEQVNQWDMHMHDVEGASEEENAENNEVLHQMARDDYGVDTQDPTFRVDENANILPRSIVRPALIAGPRSAPLERGGHVDAIVEERDLELTDPRNDRITSLLEVARRRAMDGGNQPSEWTPSPEDHEFHVPYSAPATFASDSADRGLTEQEVIDRQIQEQTAREECILQQVATREDVIFAMFRPASSEYDDIYD
ncbi:Asparagine-rich protein (ARP protein) [Pestalotiopsis sp. IQ-011]